MRRAGTFRVMRRLRAAAIAAIISASPVMAADRVVPFKYKGETFFVILHEGAMARGQIDIADHAKRVLYSLPAGACVNCPIERAGR